MRNTFGLITILAIILALNLGRVAFADKVNTGTVQGVQGLMPTQEEPTLSQLAPGTKFTSLLLDTIKARDERIAKEKAEAKRIALEKQRAAEIAAQALRTQSDQVQEVPQVYNPTTVQSMIIHWANVYGVSSSWMLNIARCESTYGQDWAYMGHYGLYQYLPETWADYSSQAGVSAPLSDMDAQAHVTAWALANGHAGAWECA